MGIRVREKWVDAVKVIACILVVFGHFFQSMTKANILPGYSIVDNVHGWSKNILKKALALGVPYIAFSTATWVLKTVFSSSVNDQIGGLGSTLLLHPTSPYWYLYALFFIFLVTPTFKNTKAAVVGLIVALIMKTSILIGGGTAYMRYQQSFQTKYGLCWA